MKELLRHKYELAEIERHLTAHRIKEELKHKEIKQWGERHYTKEIREQIILLVKNDEDKNWAVPELIECSNKWGSSNLTYSDILIFATYDTNVQSVEHKDYSGSISQKIFKILLGGGGK
ncbi:hypothetical protein ACP8HI_04400 [Paenibacillus sp. FA6]|uniref:hypothetical protein n=1 Tax=Paenibacillus sp. FA6 TaxID=3413029 RepID=UPI003F65A359